MKKILFLFLVLDVAAGGVLVNIYTSDPRRITIVRIDSVVADEAREKTTDEGGALVQGDVNIDIEKKIMAEIKDEVMLAIARAESGLNPEKHSETDILADGRSFSVGLYQINLTVHDMDGIQCYKAFSGRNYEAVVINEALFSECVKMAENPEKNIKKAKEIYQKSGLKAWGAYNNNSYKKFL